MGFEVMAKTTPVHHSSLHIKVVILDCAATYQSGKLVQCCMKSLHGQFWPRYPIKDITSAKGKTSYGWYSTIAVAPRMEGWPWPLVTVARLHRLRSVHFETQGWHTRFCEQKRSLQFADGNHAQAESGKGFCQAKGLHIKGSIMNACNQSVTFPRCGLEWIPWWRLFGCFLGCKLIPITASPLDLDWSCFWSCPSQTVDKPLGSAIDMSLQDMWLACGRRGWVACSCLDCQ